MLETKKELEAGNQASPVAKKTEIVSDFLSSGNDVLQNSEISDFSH